MKCENCGAKGKEEWNYCPKCGAMAKEEGDLFSLSSFPRFDEHLKKHMNRMMKDFDKNFEVVDLKPMFFSPKASGFSISISQSSGSKPKISIKTFGDAKKQNIEKQLEKQLMIGPYMEEAPRELNVKEKIKSRFKAAKKRPGVMKEPKSRITMHDGKVIVEIELPDVKEENIEIKKLSESVEIIGTAKNKGYFKVLAIPPQARILNKEFRNGKLTLEIG